MCAAIASCDAARSLRMHYRTEDAKLRCAAVRPEAAVLWRLPHIATHHELPLGRVTSTTSVVNPWQILGCGVALDAAELTSP